MVNVTIRGVPEELLARLRALARERGQTLHACMLDILSQEAQRPGSLVAPDQLAGEEHPVETRRDPLAEDPGAPPG